jgi:hypothetical protein
MSSKSAKPSANPRTLSVLQELSQKKGAAKTYLARNLKQTVKEPVVEEQSDDELPNDENSSKKSNMQTNGGDADKKKRKLGRKKKKMSMNGAESQSASSEPSVDVFEFKPVASALAQPVASTSEPAASSSSASSDSIDISDEAVAAPQVQSTPSKSAAANASQTPKAKTPARGGKTPVPVVQSAVKASASKKRTSAEIEVAEVVVDETNDAPVSGLSSIRVLKFCTKLF